MCHGVRHRQRIQQAPDEQQSFHTATIVSLGRLPQAMLLSRYLPGCKHNYSCSLCGMTLYHVSDLMRSYT